MGEALDTVRRMLTAFDEADDVTLRSLLAADVVMEAPGPVRLSGRDAVADYSARFLSAFADLTVQTHVLAEQGEMVVEEYTLVATHAATFTTPAGEALPPTGRRVSVRIAEVYRVQDGHITENRFYFDAAHLYHQLTPAPAHPAVSSPSARSPTAR
ncbi:ester cyclase [Parafrankia sp. FMc6]|uniref:ester cyclase n=1 Tax=Parafrankia soli TaxID=2599596 RepID=UPI0034D6681E